MCGIYGYFDRSGAALPDATLAQMDRLLTHRGPDDSGHVRFSHGAIGNRRLSIIDIEGGHQPMTAAEGKVSVVQNGEIFNFVELAEMLRRDGIALRTRSDTEVLLALYLRDGVDFVRHLNGMFAIAVHDGRGDRPVLHLYRDRMGVKPLYVHDNGTRLTFASEIKPIFATGVRPVANREALHHFLVLNYVPPPLTAFDGIRHVPPGGRLSISPTGMVEDHWWRLADIQPQPMKLADASAELLALLDDAVRIRLRADVPFGAFLSGGIDSSTVTGLMAMHMSRPVDTFSIGFEDQRFDETRHAHAVSQRFGTNHRHEIVSPRMLGRWPDVLHHLEQPHGDVSFMPTLRVAELAAAETKMVLTGDGSDELFAGYDKYLNFFGPDATFGDAATFARTYTDSALTLFPETTLDADLYASGAAKAVAGLSTHDLIAGHLADVPQFDHLTRALYLDALLLLPGNNLVKPDRMGMAVSLEARTPFLDYRVVELAFRMKAELKLSEGRTKHILKHTVRPLLGSALTDRSKQMFTVPVGEWLKQDLAGHAREMLLSDQFNDRGLFQPDTVRLLLESHIQGSRNNTREVRALMALEHWHRLFIDADTDV